MPNVDVNGASIYYESTGRGRPLLFVHGMCGNANVWDAQVRRLSDSFRCVAYDRRGHTRSTLGNITQRSVDLHADDAAALIRALKLDDCVYVGSSGGARIGVNVALRHPDAIAGAVLSEPPILSLDPDGRAEFMGLVGPAVKRATEKGPAAAVDAFFALVCPGLWSALPDARKQLYRDNARELFGDLEMPPFAPSDAELSACQARVRFLVGTETMPVFAAVAKRLAALIPGAALVEIAGSGHVTYAEQPAAFERAVREFAQSA